MAIVIIKVTVLIQILLKKADANVRAMIESLIVKGR